MEEQKPKKSKKLIIALLIAGFLLSFVAVTGTNYYNSYNSANIVNNPLCSGNRTSFTNGSDSEVSCIDINGNMKGVGNSTFIYGYFTYLGDITIHPITAYIDNIFTKNINASVTNSTYFYQNGSLTATQNWTQSQNYAPNSSLNNYALNSTVPTKISQINNDLNYLNDSSNYLLLNGTNQTVSGNNIFTGNNIFSSSNGTSKTMFDAIYVKQAYFRGDFIYSGGSVSTGKSWCEYVDLHKGWNAISLVFNRSNDFQDRNVSISAGWNLIGYSADIAYAVRDVQFTADGGSPCWYYQCTNIHNLTWANNGTLDMNGTFFDYIYKNNAYWIYADVSGNLTFKNVGGSYSNASYNWSQLWFSNGTTELNVTDAVSAYWIERNFNYWNNGFKTICVKSIPPFCDRTTIPGWNGIFIKSLVDNITLITDNSSCVGRMTMGEADTQSVHTHDLYGNSPIQVHDNLTMNNNSIDNLSMVCFNDGTCQSTLNQVNITNYALLNSSNTYSSGTIQSFDNISTNNVCYSNGTNCLAVGSMNYNNLIRDNISDQQIGGNLNVTNLTALGSKITLFAYGSGIGSRGGQIEFKTSNTNITGGYIFMNTLNRTVFKTISQISSIDAGSAWIDNNNGNANFKNITATGLTDSALTSGRVVMASTSGLITDGISGGNVTWDGATMTLKSSGSGSILNLIGGTGGIGEIGMGGNGVVSGRIDYNNNFGETFEFIKTPFGISNDILIVSPSSTVTKNAYLGVAMTQITAPTNTVVAGGSIPDGGYYYLVTAVDYGETESDCTNSVSKVANFSGGNNAVIVTWTGIPGAKYYRIYRSNTTRNGYAFPQNTYLGISTNTSYFDNASVTDSSRQLPCYKTTGMVNAFGFNSTSWIGTDLLVNGTITTNSNINITNLINLNIATLPSCDSTANGSIGRNNSGVFGCNASSSWVRLF